MGKANIISGDPEALYQIEVIQENSGIELRKAKIQAEINGITTTLLPAAEQEVIKAQDNFNAAKQVVDNYVVAVHSGQAIDFNAFAAIQGELLKTVSILDHANKKVSRLKIRLKTLQAELDRLNQYSPPIRLESAWCADFTLDLTGAAGTIEFSYDKDRTSIILPGHPNAVPYRSPYDPARDGQLTDFFNQNEYQLYTNRAYLPAWTKWKCKYRAGVLTAIDYPNDKGTLTLDPLIVNQSRKQFNMNKVDTLVDIPIVYMDCNSEPFLVGDHVVVAFEDLGNDNWQAQKRIIGFYDHPKECREPVYVNYAGNTWKHKYNFSGPVGIGFGSHQHGTCQDIIRNEKIWCIAPSSYLAGVNEIRIGLTTVNNVKFTLPRLLGGPANASIYLLAANSTHLFISETAFPQTGIIRALSWIDIDNNVFTNIVQMDWPFPVDFPSDPNHGPLITNNSFYASNNSLMIAGHDTTAGAPGYRLAVFNLDIVNGTLVLNFEKTFEINGTEFTVCTLNNRYACYLDSSAGINFQIVICEVNGGIEIAREPVKEIDVNNPFTFPSGIMMNRKSLYTTCRLFYIDPFIPDLTSLDWFEWDDTNQILTHQVQLVGGDLYYKWPFRDAKYLRPTNPV